MSEVKATDYSIAIADAERLMNVTLLPAEFRRQAIDIFCRERGFDALKELFVQFIGLANSVVANNREMVELLLITEGGLHPHTVHQANLPTLFGALNGIVLTEGIDQNKTCNGCAFRQGTCANQSPCTSIDADLCADDGTKFYCHEHLDASGVPHRKCTGFTQARKLRAREQEAA